MINRILLIVIIGAVLGFVLLDTALAASPAQDLQAGIQKNDIKACCYDRPFFVAEVARKSATSFSFMPEWPFTLIKARSENLAIKDRISKTSAWFAFAFHPFDKRPMA